jgi:hypothetical protein
VPLKKTADEAVFFWADLEVEFAGFDSEHKGFPFGA